MSPPIMSSSTLSFSTHILSDPTHTFLTSRFSHLSIAKPPPSTTIRMGGGPRTFPGGVSKWQWKRMQQKKAKQLLRARLARERQIYEMRKRAELSAAVSELERPWEVVEKAPKLFSVTADEQLKVLADRFQKPGGLDLWSEKDGPQLFETVDGLPSARFFPKGVVHSIKPYGRITDGRSSSSSDGENSTSRVQGEDPGLGQRNGHVKKSRNAIGKSMKLDSGDGLNQREFGGNWRKESKMGNLRGRKEQSGSNSKVFDMNLQDDGSYGVSKKEPEIKKVRRRPERK
ncbi:hypothetical protein SSX86_026618 [Deinandra increscens subsp. villosa]|uniref:DEAD-box ATP-dependent RNA helicase 33 n=1 Tax=Deinandra increscens subsp. villosa TaxID=3103831 RepID=A0AAP0CEV4_9ASTR